MPIDPALEPGLDAYRRGDYEAAREAWRRALEGREGHRRSLCEALADLAELLDAEDPGARHEEALDGAREDLTGLADAVDGIDVRQLRAALARSAGELRARPPMIRNAPLLPRGTLKFLLLVVLLAASALAFRFTPLADLLSRETVVEIMLTLRESWWAPIAHVAATVIAAPLGLPMTPFIFAGGLVFGIARGAVLNAIGTLVGALLSYEVALLLGRDFVAQVAGRRLRRIELMIARRGFWALVGVRFMPVPFPLINYGAALAGVARARFAVTSTVGLVPAMLIYTYFAATVAEVMQGGDADKLPKVGLAITLVMLLSISPAIAQGLKRRRRYRRLVEERSRRGSSGPASEGHR